MSIIAASMTTPAGTSPPTTTSSSRRSAAPQAGPKLRDSCHACASSKVKCHKEKPTCSRCAKRGITCEYFVTRRGGRHGTNHERRATISTGTSTAPPMSSWFDSNSMLSTTDFAVTPMVQVPSHHPSPTHTPRTNSSASINTANFIVDDVCPVDPALSSDIDSFFASPISLSDTDLFNQSDLFSGIDSASTSLDTFFLMDESLSAPITTPPSPMYNGSSSSSSLDHHQDGCCLVKALGLMKELFPNSSTACSSVSSSPKQQDSMSLGGDSHPMAMQTVINQNRRTVEAVGSILSCSCSRDGYLLSVLALIVFKVLRWYAAAAGKTLPAATLAETVLQTPTRVGSYSLEGEHSAHMAAKLVLSELHRVQRLVSMLSERLRTSHSADLDTGGMASPFSAAVLDQLGVDLKKQLKGLSRDIVEGLRKEC
ncbi:aflatoxin regulatory protein-domain-containing protein [Cladorrhinum sp. PSN259]|nr:aflatoxin regulatory protein-domain-containing protein [Cladorrhinum sp. PSN259]